MQETTEHGPMYDEEWGVDLSDVLGDGGGEDQTASGTEDVAASTEEPKTEESAAEAQQDNKQEEPSAEEQPAEPANSDVFTLKHMGSEVQLDLKREEDRKRGSELMQMGMDYGRVKGQRDEFRKQVDELRQYQTENAELVDFIRDLARQSGISAEQLMDEIRVNQYAKRNNVSQELARERVAREKLERQLQAQEAKKQPKITPEEAEKQRRDKDIQDFLHAFPDVKPSEIDKSVWDGVKDGKSLKESYQDFLYRKQLAEKDAENQRLKTELEAQRKNQENRAKTIGSQKSGIQEDGKDKFLEAFLSDD